MFPWSQSTATHVKRLFSAGLFVPSFAQQGHSTSLPALSCFGYFSPCHPSKPRSVLTLSIHLSCSSILWYVFLNASHLTFATHNLVLNYKAYCLFLSPALSCSLEPIIVSPGRLALNNCLLNWTILFSNCFRFVHLTCLTWLKTLYAFVFPHSVKHRGGTQR